jgi:hypothetical protein
MENSSNKPWSIFKGAGLLLGIAVSLVGALVVFTLSDSFAAAMAAALPIGVFTGISMEQAFHGNNKQTDPGKTKIIVRSLVFGLITFMVLYMVLKLL